MYTYVTKIKNIHLTVSLLKVVRDLRISVILKALPVRVGVYGSKRGSVCGSRVARAEAECYVCHGAFIGVV